MTTRRLAYQSIAYLAILLFLALFLSHPLPASTSWQSQLPTPELATPGNPYYLRADVGGRIYCGLQQSSVWLEIPPGFTSAAGAEFRCDATPVNGAVGTQGYLIGFWPMEIPISQPLMLVFELDPIRVPNDCDQCFTGRYYEAATAKWHDLPTEYAPAIVAAHVWIDRYLPGSGYEGYSDRFLVAVFEAAKATSTPKVAATPKASPSPRPTPLPSASAAIIPSLPPPPSPTATVASSPSPFAQVVPTTPATALVVLAASSSQPVPTATLISTTFVSQSPQPSDSSGLIVLLVLIILILALASFMIVIVLKRRRLQKR